jgi:hypothetical protein
MTRTSLLATAALIVACAAASAQTAPTTFDQAAYVTCREAQTMPPQQRMAVAVLLAEHAARHRGVTIPNGPPGAQIGHLVRGGCTLAPDAYLFTVIDLAVLAEQAKLPRRR